MNLTHPAALLWLLLAVPIVVFYILKIRLKRVPVSTTIFWRQIFDEKKPRSLWQRLRHLVSLLVQLVLLWLLVSALTEPFLTGRSQQPERVILVFDNSASLNAVEGDKTRFELAMAQAKNAVEELRSRDEMAIVAAGTQPRVACGVTGHQRTLRTALEGVKPSDGPTKLTEAVATAQRLASEKQAEGQTTRIVVVTDGCDPSIATLKETPNVSLVSVGTKLSNAAITRFQVRRSTIDPLGYEILAEVRNFSDEPTADGARLTIKLNGNVIDIKPLKIVAEGKWSQTIESVTQEGGELTAELGVKAEGADTPYPDALALDNRAVAILPRRDRLPVQLYTPSGNLFLQMVLRAGSLVDLTTTKDVPAAFPEGFKGVRVFHKTVPAKIPAGNVLVIDPANGCDLFSVGERVSQPIVTQQDKTNPLMASVRLDNVPMPDARKLTFTPAAGKPQVLAAALSQEPIFALIERPEGAVAILTVDLDKGELPFRTAFPILITNTLGRFAGGAGELRESLATGSVAEVTLPATGTDYVLTGPDGSRKKLPAGVAKTAVGPFETVGVWSVTPDAPDAKPVEQYAVNLMSAAESDLRPVGDLPTAPPVFAGGLLGQLANRPAWFYLLAAACGLFGLEWYLYQRRWIS